MAWLNVETGLYSVGDKQSGQIEVPERKSSTDQWISEVWVPGPAPVPQSVTPLQARRAMRQAGVLDAVKAAVANDPEMQDAFDYAISFNREGTFIGNAQALLQWTDAQIDDLFRLAATFTD